MIERLFLIASVSLMAAVPAAAGERVGQLARVVRVAAPAQAQPRPGTFKVKVVDEAGIVYRTGAGLQIGGDWSGVKDNIVEGNVFVAKRAIRNTPEAAEAPKGPTLRNNRFYCDEGPRAESSTGTGNSMAAYSGAAAKEGWPDPNRTLKRYVTEVLGLTLLDWNDDPLLAPPARDARAEAGEPYDPTGLKTFMAVATNMRRGGVHNVPARGKPSWTGDYTWDERLTGRAVVNWIRAGFALPPVAR